ncbi:MAG: MFS transporter [Chloroflexi bacterium]|nr:MFS transporter [Chloroflexota bacterium]
MHMRWRSWMAPFFTIWIGQAFSLIGSSLVQFALVWWLTERTGSATILATATLAGMLPGIILGPLAGACVDRWNRRMVLIVSDGIVAAASAGLAALAWGGHLAVWHVYVAMALRSLGGAFHWPAMQASTSLMVPKEQLTRVAGMNQTVHGVLNIVSPPLGALIIGLLPLHGVMGIDVITATLAILPLFVVAIPQPARSEAAGAASATSLLTDMRAGIAYVWRWPAIMGVIGMAMLINLLFNPAFSLIPLLITRHMGGGAIHLGTVNSAFGIGVVAGGLLLGVWGGFRKSVHTSMLGVIGMGVGVLTIGASPDGSLWVVITGMLLAGAMNPLANGPLFALLQRTVEPDMQGRVFTVLSSGCGAIAPLGLALAGPITDAVGLRPWYLAAGLMAVAMGLAGLRFRPFLRMEEDAPSAAPPLPGLQATAIQDAAIAGE